MWLILWGCGRVNARTGGGTWQRMAITRGRGSPVVSPSVERGAAAFAVEAVGGGGLPRRTSQPRRRNNSDPGEHFPPFVFSLPPLSDLYRVFTKRPQFRQSLKSAAEYIYNLHARRIYNILHERAIIILSYTHTPARPCLFFSFFFFLLFLFFFYLFFYLFFYVPFLFVCLFAFRRFLFFFSFFFFSLLAFFKQFRRRRRVSLSPPLPPLLSSLSLGCAFHNKRPWA